ncbi:hypothetical protein F2Q68_00009059 [Brassica cretica]|uniref:Uncharacterized protein n=1 Tax=Brassica cretica TaxID=69181 RepID=A0A8S9KUV4_BRACR|nr:hypothetical protein F2Q68_00009059 [Brassica cretica]
MFRLHFAYMSPYQVLEYHMEFLETFGCIWSSKEVFNVIIGRAAHGSDQSGATPSSRSDLPIGATLPERQGGVFEFMGISHPKGVRGNARDNSSKLLAYFAKDICC